jgi:hypothetical protein
MTTTFISQARLKRLECIEEHYTDIIAQGIAFALDRRPRRRRRKIIRIRPMTPVIPVPRPVSACPSPTHSICAPVQPPIMEIPIATKPLPLDNSLLRKRIESLSDHRPLSENPSTYTSPGLAHVDAAVDPIPPKIYNSIAQLTRSLYS